MRTTRAIMALALALACAGCVGGGGVGIERPESVRMRVSGSAACQPMLELLCAEWPGSGLEFVFIPGLRSGGAIDGVSAGELEVAAVATVPAMAALPSGLVYTPLALDALALAAHPSVEVTSLSSEQVRGIFAGRYESWSELGGDELPIVIMDRDEGDTAKIAVRATLLGSAPVDPRAVQLYNEVEMAEAIERTPGAVGFLSMGCALASGAKTVLVALDGVRPSAESVRSGEYRLVRPLGVVTRADSPAELGAFLEWAAGEGSGAVLERAGYVPARVGAP